MYQKASTYDRRSQLIIITGSVVLLASIVSILYIMKTLQSGKLQGSMVLNNILQIYKRVHGKLFYLIFLDISRHVLKIRDCYSLPIWKCVNIFLVRNAHHITVTWPNMPVQPVSRRKFLTTLWRLYANRGSISVSDLLGVRKNGGFIWITKLDHFLPAVLSCFEASTNKIYNRG
jgi:hypothetical protein